jgi:hypothetical protein
MFLIPLASVTLLVFLWWADLLPRPYVVVACVLVFKGTICSCNNIASAFLAAGETSESSIVAGLEPVQDFAVAP